ncbi:MAG TPA: ABC transporter permease [Spirochaetota bacterium]|nr:ABC transporter permease [Spirochaetota bacterium]HNT12552.1 ABC transporter permease [Spirochaetota bacterium]HNV46505.1 ABC transporter permease [Spirochaetota bacterium]HPI23625.1 ABC transporter permease [Spirochaetota bacterium]HPU89648.1 ABC transporter permease [Spirochaetota bacterium]
MSGTIIIIRGLLGKCFGSFEGVRKFFAFVRSIFVSFRSLRYLRLRSLVAIAVNQTRFTGYDALPIIVVISLILGATVIIQATQNFPKFGIEGFIGNLLVIIIARELGPLATAMVVMSRSGSAIATEIATQKQGREIQSLELMGIDSRLYIVIPRIAASIASILSLIIIFDIVAFFGGYLISLSTVFIPIDIFLQTLLDSMSADDLIITLVKSVVYGTTIPLVCCYYGFMPRSKFEIPIYVSRAVMRTLLILFVVNALISALFYL